MYCANCGKEIPDGKTLCDDCLKQNIENGNATPPPVPSANPGTVPEIPKNIPTETPNNIPPEIPQTAQLNNSGAKGSKGKMLRYIVGGIVAAVLVIISILYNNDPVRRVKGGKFNDYQQKTVSAAFEGFFTNTDWTSYKEQGDTYVKFTGNCTLAGEPAKAKIIFLIHGKNFDIARIEIGNMDFTNAADAKTILDIIYSN